MMAVRTMLAGVGLGAALLAGLLATPSSWATHSLVPDLVKPEQVASGEGWTQPGTCLAAGASGHPNTVVDCRKEHVFELASAVDLAAYPGSTFTSSAYPTAEQHAEIREQLCGAEVNAYLGGKLDGHGRFKAGLLMPSPSAWTQGDRVVDCGIEVPSVRGKLLVFTGPVATQDQSPTYDLGVCVGVEHNMPTEPVDCREAHAFEIVGQVDLEAQFPDRPSANPPSEDEQNDKLKELCAKSAENYLGDAERLRTTTLDVSWTILKPQSWFVGSRKVVCFLAKLSEQGEGFSVITGSAKGNVLVNGIQPVAPPKPTRSTAAPVTPPARPAE